MLRDLFLPIFICIAVSVLVPFLMAGKSRIMLVGVSVTLMGLSLLLVTYFIGEWQVDDLTKELVMIERTFVDPQQTELVIVTKDERSFSLKTFLLQYGEEKDLNKVQSAIRESGKASIWIAREDLTKPNVYGIEAGSFTLPPVAGVKFLNRGRWFLLMGEIGFTFLGITLLLNEIWSVSRRRHLQKGL